CLYLVLAPPFTPSRFPYTTLFRSFISSRDNYKLHPSPHLSTAYSYFIIHFYPETRKRSSSVLKVHYLLHSVKGLFTNSDFVIIAYNECILDKKRKKKGKNTRDTKKKM